MNDSEIGNILKRALSEVENNGYRPPQPYGKIVAEYYENGQLENQAVCLMVIAHLLERVDNVSQPRKGMLAP